MNVGEVGADNRRPTWVDLELDRPNALGLGRAAIELAVRAAHAPPEESVRAFEEELTRGRLTGTLLRAGGRTIGIAFWRSLGRVGLSVGPIAFEPTAATPERYDELLQEIGQRVGTVTFVAGPLLGLEAPAEARVMEGAGFARYGRMEMELRFPRAPLTTPDPPTNASVRTVGRDDASALVELHARAYRGRFDRYLFLEEEDEREDARVLVHGILEGRWGEFAPEGSRGLERERRLVAATLVARRPRGPMILDVMVDPELRGRGLGRAVLSETVRALAGSGAEVVHLNVTEGNTPALRLYRELGFVVTMGPTHDWYSTRRIPVPPQVGEAPGGGAGPAGSGR
jgi:ribosomal protein S18 acetylase RimI-like enzyme